MLAHFKKHEEVFPTATKIFEIEKNRIKNIFPSAIIEHVGASSVPDLLTLGDLDIQIRTEKNEFDKIIKLFHNFYHPHYPELWTNEFAIFHQKDHPIIELSIMVTVIDSPDDEFHSWRDRLINDLELRRKYNTLKLNYEGKPLADYKKARVEFFGGSNGAKRQLK